MLILITISSTGKKFILGKSMKNMIHPVLLCGGAGSRLWPLSRKLFPKQFVKLTGEESLFQKQREG